MMYYVQGAYSDGYLCHEDSYEDESKALRAAQALKESLYFEGDHVRVIDIYGQLIWEGGVQ